MFIGKIGITVVAMGVAAAFVATAVPAGAAVTSVRITAGNAASGTATFAMSSGSITLKDLTSAKNASCGSSSLTGNQATLGTHGNPAASIAGSSSATTFTSCVVPFGANIPLSITGASVAGNPWRVQADNPTAKPSGGSNPLPPSNPVVGQATPVTLYNISLKITTSSCSFPITGSISGGSYTNTSSGATVTLPAKTTAAASNLTIGQITLMNGATSCVAGIFHTGDKISLATTYTISATGSTANPIWLNAG